ncbi:MAG: hypothetical protein HPY79_05585 [Bacteroidales bacterium]|nr:hypothetical protein [Bacteroidales bacterium]
MNLYKIIEELCAIHAPSGYEKNIITFLYQWFLKTKSDAQLDTSVSNTLVVYKGKPNIAFIAHADSVGFILQYNKRLLALGSPEISDNTLIRSSDGRIVEVYFDETNHVYLIKNDFEFERGTTFTFLPHFEIKENFLYSNSLDNRIGIALLMQLYSETDDICIVISSNEESSGGSVEKASRILYEKYKIEKTVIVDTTFETEGIRLGNGVVLSLKDRYLPPQRWVEQIKEIINEHNIPHQIEVEDYGISDGAYIHRSPYPIDWIFLGIACANNHQQVEKIDMNDLKCLYEAIKTINNKYLKSK